MRRIILGFTLLALLAATSLASPPMAGAVDRDKQRLARLDSDLAALEDPEARARRILEEYGKLLYNHEIFSRLEEAPSETAREFLRSVLTDTDSGPGQNAENRQKAAWALGQVGLPEDAALLRKVAAEDPTTIAHSGGIAYEANAREVAGRALAELAKRYPEESGSWLK